MKILKDKRLQAIVILFIAIISIVIILSGNKIIKSFSNGYSFSDKVVIAYYYMWFTEGWFDGSEGNAGEALADIHPTLGSYNSADPAIIEQHVIMAKQAKIDAFVASWWYDSSANGMNDKLAFLFQKAQNYDLKVGINLEAEFMERPETILEALRYYLTEYSNHLATLKVEGEPVILIWGTWNKTPAVWQEIFDTLENEGLPAFYLTSQQTDPSYLDPFRSLESYVSVDIEDSELPAFYQNLKYQTDVYNEANPDNLAQWHAVISPGFDERNIPGRETGPGGAGWKDRNDGEYYQMTFDAALSSDPDWIHITSFNELAEHTHIEPTEEFGWTYINMTASFVDQFKQSGETPNLNQEGRLVKVVNGSTIYYLSDIDHNRYIFPDENVYYSWYYDFNNIEIISYDELQTYPLVGNITMRPGTHLIKISSNPQVYAVEPGGILRWIVDEETFLGLGYDFSMVIAVSEIFFGDYIIGEPVTCACQHPIGSLIKYSSSSAVYYWDGSHKRSFVNENAFLQNRFYWGYVLTISEDFSYSNGEVIFGKEDGLVLSY